MDFIPSPNIHWASYSHSCAIVFSLVVPVCEVLLFKTNEKRQRTAPMAWEKKTKHYFLKSIRSVVEVWQKWNFLFLLLKNFANLIVKVPHNRKYEGLFCVY